MAWSAPISWTTGQIVSAANLNEQLRDNSTFLHDSYLPFAGGTMTGQLVAAVGTVGAPGVAFAGSLTSGFYRPAADQIGVAIAGVQRVLITATGMTLTGALTASTDAAHLFGAAAAVDDPEELRKSTAGIAAFVLDSTGTGTPQFVARANPGATPTVELGSRSNHALLLLVNSAEKARFDTAGNLGLGVTPETWNSGRKAFQFGNSGVLSANTTGTTMNVGSNYYDDNVGGGTSRRINAGYAAMFRLEDGAYYWYKAGTDAADSAITWTAALVLDNPGNLGLGVTPEAWTAGYTAFQIGGNGSIMSDAGQAASGVISVMHNAYLNTGAWRYISTDEATRYYQDSGTHVWQVAASGAADSAISWTTALTIDNNAYLNAAVRLGVAMTPVRTLDVTGTFGATGAGTIGGLLTASADVNITGSASSALYALQVLVATTKTDQGAAASVYGISVGGGGGTLQKTASTGNLYGMYVTVNITVDATKTADRAAQLALNGVTATVNGTLTNHNALYLGVPVNGSTAQIIGTAVAGCFLTTGGTWTDASHEMAPDGRQWKLRRPERMAGLDPLALVRAMKVHAYDLTDAWFEEEQDETVIDWEDDPVTGLSVPRQRVERKRRLWQVHEKDRSGHIGYFAEELHRLNPLLCRDGLGLNPLAICAVNTWAIQELAKRDDQRKRSIDDLWAENQQLKARVTELESKVA